MPEYMNLTKIPVCIAAVILFVISAIAPLPGKSNLDYPPLHSAVINGDLETVKSLLSRGADPNEGINYPPDHPGYAGNKSKEGMTPLYFAASKGYREIAEYLLQHGADPKAIPSPMVCAISNGHLEIVDLLFRHGGKVTSEYNGRTLLHVACERRQELIVKYLIEKGADVNAKDSDNKTSLMYAVNAHSNTVLQLLLANGADVNIRDKNGNSPLHIAALHGFNDTAGILVSHHANIDALNAAHNAPLHTAVRNNRKEIVQLLLNNGADVNIRDNKGMTPLHIAAGSRIQDTSLLKIILSHNPALSLKDHTGCTAYEYSYGKIKEYFDKFKKSGIAE